MTRFRLSPEAAQDVIDIYEYIAQDSVDAAERVRAEIYDAILGLAAMPGKGHRREDLKNNRSCSGPSVHFKLFTARSLSTSRSSRFCTASETSRGS